MYEGNLFKCQRLNVLFKEAVAKKLNGTFYTIYHLYSWGNIYCLCPEDNSVVMGGNENERKAVILSHWKDYLLSASGTLYGIQLNVIAFRALLWHLKNGYVEFYEL